MKKYSKIKKRILAGASGGILASMLWISGPVYADTTEYTPPAQTQNTKGMHLMRRWNSPAKVNALVAQLGLDKEEIRQEMLSGKTLKQVLQERGIDLEELNRAFSA